MQRRLPHSLSHSWTLEYVPRGTSTNGLITVTLDDQPVRLDLAEEHRNAGAQFDRFGFITTWIDGNGQEVYFDDLAYTVHQN